MPKPVAENLVKLSTQAAATERQSHPTFEAYCKGKWGFERRQAYRLMDAAQVVENVSNWTQTIPATESQARPLTRLEPEVQQAVWEGTKAYL